MPISFPTGHDNSRIPPLRNGSAQEEFSAMHIKKPESDFEPSPWSGP
jgi:hypothetical protein